MTLHTRWVRHFPWESSLPGVYRTAVTASQNRRVRQKFFRPVVTADSARFFRVRSTRARIKRAAIYGRRLSIPARISLGTAVLTGFNHAPHSPGGVNEPRTRDIRYDDNTDISSRGESVGDISGRRNGACGRIRGRARCNKTRDIFSRRGYWNALRFAISAPVISREATIKTNGVRFCDRGKSSAARRSGGVYSARSVVALYGRDK